MHRPLLEVIMLSHRSAALIVALTVLVTGCAISRAQSTTSDPTTATTVTVSSASTVSAPTVSTSTASTSPQAPIAELALVPYVQGLRSIHVEVGGHKVPFIFDTGGGVVVITPEIAERVGCQPFGQVTGFRADGQRLAGRRCGPVSLASGAYEAEEEVSVFDLSGLLQGAPPIGDQPVGGLMSLAAFKGQMITLDYAGGRLIVETPESLQHRIRHMQPLEIRIGHQAGGAALDLFVAVESASGPLWMSLDSGNAGPIKLPPHALEQLGTSLPEGRGPLKLTMSGLGEVEVEARESELIYDGLINTQFFEDHMLALDLAAGRAWARRVPQTE